MSIIKLKDLSFKRAIEAIGRRIVSIYHLGLWILPTQFSKENKIKLRRLKDIHKGKRCFIIANGPSLNKIDLTLLKDEITIGMNRIYLIEEKIGYLPNYLVVSDIPIQLKQFSEEYGQVKTIKLYNWWARHLFANDTDINFFYQHFTCDFQPDFTKTVGNSKSVTYVCMQLAFYMGFDEVYLIGKDHSYQIDGKAGLNVKADGSEANHFISGYYKPGQKWKIPNYLEEEYTYAIARKAFEKAGRMIKDATVDGKLEIFEKVDFNSLFETVNK
ncbi:6-hydroxymethylpterin diphosphokinase MptE-like protein [Mucilaginibacter sp.]|uniref:6-hydroxymethylpterin diphosphokinase MptE-like protein n=1 Tax=Mucilaginibacter sp. TaxID=1882438 RepID=UPI0028522921|nr:6-hydroxymethylpterin diphosphokinase MptE-like protein [Mucilaginibacter sp.]MDR3696314.1 DUF115 domain-containing protein [Mucilaginibacter sp.]